MKNPTIESLQRLENKFAKRISLYKSKKATAVGTDIVNQGSKIKALTECLDDVRIEMATGNIHAPTYRTSDGKYLFDDFTKAQILEAASVLSRMKAIKEDANFMLIVADVVNAFNKIQGNGLPPYVMNRGGGANPAKR